MVAVLHYNLDDDDDDDLDDDDNYHYYYYLDCYYYNSNVVVDYIYYCIGTDYCNDDDCRYCYCYKY